MRRLSILLALILSSSGAAAQMTGRIDDARSLAAACGPVQRSIEKLKRRTSVPLEAGLLCLGYMQAMQDISVLRDTDGRAVFGACPSDQTRLGDLIRAFVVYANAHPDERGESAAIAVIKSFRQTFPCPPSAAAELEPAAQSASPSPDRSR